MPPLVSTEQSELQQAEEHFKIWLPSEPVRRSSDNSLISSIETLLHRLQQQDIALQDLEHIKQYLQEFPSMIEATSAVTSIAREYLPYAKFVLTVYVDPEIDDRYLVLYVRTTSYDESFLKQVERVWEASAGHLAYKRGWLQVTTDFAPPE